MEDAKEAMKNCNNTEIEGRTVRLEFSQSREERGGGGAGGGGGRGSSGSYIQLSQLFISRFNARVC